MALTPEVTSELQAIEDRYQAGVAEATPTLAYADLALRQPTGAFALLDYSADDARADMLGVLQDNDITLDDLKQSNSGSHNDSYINLGIGNTIYSDKSSGYEPPGGSSRDVNITHVAGAPVGEFSLVEQGKDTSVWQNPIVQLMATALAPLTAGLSVAVVGALSAVDGDTLHAEDYGKIAAALIGANVDLSGMATEQFGSFLEAAGVPTDQIEASFEIFNTSLNPADVVEAQDFLRSAVEVGATVTEITDPGLLEMFYSAVKDGGAAAGQLVLDGADKVITAVSHIPGLEGTGIGNTLTTLVETAPNLFLGGDLPVAAIYEAYNETTADDLKIDIDNSFDPTTGEPNEVATLTTGDIETVEELGEITDLPGLLQPLDDESGGGGGESSASSLDASSKGDRTPIGTFVDAAGRLVGWDAAGQFFLDDGEFTAAPTTGIDELFSMDNILNDSALGIDEQSLFGLDVIIPPEIGLQEPLTEEELETINDPQFGTLNFSDSDSLDEASIRGNTGFTGTLDHGETFVDGKSTGFLPGIEPGDGSTGHFDDQTFPDDTPGDSTGPGDGPGTGPGDGPGEGGGSGSGSLGVSGGGGSAFAGQSGKLFDFTPDFKRKRNLGLFERFGNS